MTDEAKSYKTAGAFRAALETRLQTRARETGSDLQRLRRQVAFDRFLARMFSKGPKATYPWVLEGGYAMELRTRFARTTKDIDLTLHDGTRLSKKPEERREQVRAMLQELAAVRSDDYFEFLIGEAIQATFERRATHKFPSDLEALRGSGNPCSMRWPANAISE
jgi:hypothetical protein